MNGNLAVLNCNIKGQHYTTLLCEAYLQGYSVNVSGAPAMLIKLPRLPSESDVATYLGENLLFLKYETASSLDISAYRLPIRLSHSVSAVSLNLINTPSPNNFTVGS